ncbi:angiopoietin-related protein 1 [Anopheles gambiae]|uniref:Fibrinogen C-terminal domain-containing protein n=1 Tax=Anopheles coluzzii TaxID=1518534 RepID=A0A6E8V4K3_ANOCL|nr:angiopoietin-related protein 1 [Anopheles gambiae]
MRQLQLLLLGAFLLLLAVAVLTVDGEPIKSNSHGHHQHHHHTHHKKKHGSHHHHNMVYGFGDPFESNGRWLQDESDQCNCNVIAQKMKKLREKVLLVVSSFDKLLKVQVDLRNIKNLLKNIDLSLTALGGFVSNSESQIAYLEEQTHAVSMLLSRAKAGAVQLLTRENLIEALGPVKSSTEAPPLQELDEIVYSSCQDRRIIKTGVYRVYTNVTNSMYVLCSLDFGQNAWTVIQNRFDGSETFFRPWNHYKRGFGYFGHGEYWLGLDNIYAMMAGREHELLILLEDFDGKFAYAKYKYFRIDGEKDDYRLAKLHGYIGNAGNSLQDAEGMKFSTYDRDNDKSPENCAQANHGGWWYKACGDTNLNGAYRKEYSHDLSGIFWKEFRGLNYSLKRSRIMMRNKKEHHHKQHYHHHAHHGYHRIDEEGYEEEDEEEEEDDEEDEEKFYAAGFEAEL